MPIQEVAKAIQAGAPPLAYERRGLPRRLVNAVDAALSIDPGKRPSASDLAHELRNAAHAPERRGQRKTRQAEPDESVAPARRHARRVLPVVLGVVTAALGATFLPFWPPELVALLVLVTGLACWLDPRLGLALALGIPIFPLGNVAVAIAGLYAIFAAGWLVLSWRDARHGLWFTSGPLLATVGLLPLVPLALIPVRSTVRRAAHGVLAVLSTVLLAALAGEQLPIAGGVAASLDVGPLDSLGSAASAVWSWLAREPVVLAAALLVAAAAALLPWARGRSRLGVPAVGFAVTAASVLAGASVAGTIVVLAVWAAFSLVTTAPRRA
jgi:hypothetical protein